MQIDWAAIDDQLRSGQAREDEAIHADFVAREHVRREMRKETADIAASLVALGHRLTVAGFEVAARAVMPDYWVKVGEHSIGIQVSLAGPSWLVLNDGVQTDEIVHIVDGDRGFWARATAAGTRIDLASYFGGQFVAFVTRVQARPQRDGEAHP